MAKIRTISANQKIIPLCCGQQDKLLAPCLQANGWPLRRSLSTILFLIQFVIFRVPIRRMRNGHLKALHGFLIRASKIYVDLGKHLVVTSGLHTGHLNMQNLNISNVEVVPCTNSRYVKASRVRLNQNGRQRTWDYINVHDCVAIMLLNTTRNAFVLVKQFRPALYMYINNEHIGKDRSEISEDIGEIEIKAPYQLGVSYELCAGLIDKKKSPKEIAKEEVLEEVGYDISIDQLQEVTTCRSVGFDGRKLTIFFAEVTDDMIVGPGGGQPHEDEEIEVEYLPVEKAKEFIFDTTKVKPPSFVAAFMWYFWKYNVS